MRTRTVTIAITPTDILVTGLFIALLCGWLPLG